MQGELEGNPVYFNRTMKNLQALALCVAALFGTGLAGATIDFDAAGDDFLMPEDPYEVGTLTFSREALGLGGRPDEQGFYIITSQDFDTIASLGKVAAYVAADSPVWVRYDASRNLKLRGSAPTLRLSQGGGDIDINPETGLGQPGFFLYKIPASNAITANTQLQLDLSNNLSLSDGRNGRLMVRIYRGSYINAIREQSKFELLRRQVTAAGTASSVGVEFQPGYAAIADVATGFAKFLPNPRLANDGDTAPLGVFGVSISHNALSHLDSAGQSISALDSNLLIGRSSTVSFSSAVGFAFADFSLAEGNDCTGTKTSLHYRGSQAYASLAVGVRTLCVTAREASDGVSASSIPEATYSAAVKFSDARGYHLLPGPVVQANFGRIRRNGTTVQLPFLSTYENYNDRIIIVNRANFPANYDLKFHTEEGIRAVPGAMASGTLAEKTTTVLRSRDVVTLNGGARTAATLSIALSQAQVDVVTQRVNLTDGSIDAILHPADGWTFSDTRPEPSEGEPGEGVPGEGEPDEGDEDY